MITISFSFACTKTLKDVILEKIAHAQKRNTHTHTHTHTGVPRMEARLLPPHKPPFHVSYLGGKGFFSMFKHFYCFKQLLLD